MLLNFQIFAEKMGQNRPFLLKGRRVDGCLLFMIQRMSKSLAKVRVRNVRKVFSSIVVGLGDISSSVNISSLLLEEAKKLVR